VAVCVRQLEQALGQFLGRQAPQLPLEGRNRRRARRRQGHLEATGARHGAALTLLDLDRTLHASQHDAPGVASPGRGTPQRDAVPLLFDPVGFLPDEALRLLARPAPGHGHPQARIALEAKHVVPGTAVPEVDDRERRPADHERLARGRGGGARRPPCRRLGRAGRPERETKLHRQHDTAAP
jgi:hypothetical protein